MKIRLAKYELLPFTNPRVQLLKEIPSGGIAAEVGTWKGEFSKKILRYTNPKKLFLVDPYHFTPDYGTGYFSSESSSQEKMDGVYNLVRQKFNAEIGKGQVEMLRVFSEQALSEFPEEHFDWLYIDGNHTYDFVKKDLAIAWNKLKTGGLLCGDDYKVVGWWEDGVTRAVDEFLNLHTSEIGKVQFFHSQFLIEKTGS